MQSVGDHKCVLNCSGNDIRIIFLEIGAHSSVLGSHATESVHWLHYNCKEKEIWRAEGSRAFSFRTLTTTLVYSIAGMNILAFNFYQDDTGYYSSKISRTRT